MVGITLPHHHHHHHFTEEKTGPERLNNLRPHSQQVEPEFKLKSIITTHTISERVWSCVKVPSEAENIIWILAIMLLYVLKHEESLGAFSFATPADLRLSVRTALLPGGDCGAASVTHLGPFPTAALPWVTEGLAMDSQASPNRLWRHHLVVLPTVLPGPPLRLQKMAVICWGEVFSSWSKMSSETSLYVHSCQPQTYLERTHLITVNSPLNPLMLSTRSHMIPSPLPRPTVLVLCNQIDRFFHFRFFF